MRSKVVNRRSRAVKFTVAAAVVSLLAACSSAPASPSTDKGKISDTSTASGDITFWTWTPGLDPIVKEFEAAHPKIKVKVVNAGQGAAEYAKLRTAMKAGSGGPDVAAVEYQYIQTFSKDLVDLNQYGVASLKDKFQDWAWLQAQNNGKQLGMPWDTAPMEVVYRADILKKHGIAEPTTWEEFATAARKLHAADPSVFLTNMAPNDPGQFLSLTAQAGSRPYKLSGEKDLTLALNDPGAKKWADFWTPLIKDGVISTDPAWNDSWYKGLADGRYASWITAAWGPVFLQGTAASTSGKWSVVALPQWEAGQNASAAWGGSTFAVPTQSTHKAAAAEFAKWMSTSAAATKFTSMTLFGFPSTKALLEDPAYVDQKVTFFADQQPVKVYMESAKGIDTSFSYSPFQDYVYSQMSAVLSKAMANKTDLSAAFDTLQSTTVDYARVQGYKVNGK